MIAAPLLFALPLAFQAGSETALRAFEDFPVYTVEGQLYPSWQAWRTSGSYRPGGLRCLTPSTSAGPDDSSARPPSDCSLNNTNPTPEYDPTFSYDIPVVVHVIRSNSGQGDISPALVQSQIDILNEDFQAIPGTNGEPGTDGKIRFHLATEDPNGNATTGITYSNNNTWFNDSGNYYDSLAWDTHRYLNIYTNQASGALGYVPDLPQSGNLVGSNRDRVVCLWSAFGRNAPIGPPYNQGRTATHEVGHYLGLFHTFSGGCGGGNCYTSGDRVCDTNPEANPRFGCPGNAQSCNSPDPYHNYMDYSDDLCMNQFTEEQVNRMRCVLVHWRPDLAEVSGIGDNYCQANANSSGQPALISAEGSESIAANDFTLISEVLPANQSGIFFYGSNQVQQVFGNGFRCVSGNIVRRGVLDSGPAGRLEDAVDLTTAPNISIGVTLNFQAWFRDPMGAPTTFDLSDGLEVTFLP